MCATIRLQYLPVVKKMAKGRKFVQLEFLMVYPVAAIRGWGQRAPSRVIEVANSRQM